MWTLTSYQPGSCCLHPLSFKARCTYRRSLHWWRPAENLNLSSIRIPVTCLKPSFSWLLRGLICKRDYCYFVGFASMVLSTGKTYQVSASWTLQLYFWLSSWLFRQILASQHVLRGAYRLSLQVRPYCLLMKDSLSQNALRWANRLSQSL